MSDYFFGNDEEAEERRLLAVESYSDPVSRSVLRELGVGNGWVCWEIGAGRGSVAYWLSDLVGPDGRVLATDIDTRRLHDLSNLEVVRHDVVEDDPPEDGFDLIHARFLLEHLPEPEKVLDRLVSVLGPGGLLVVEDTNGLDLRVDPHVVEIAEICRAWEAAARSISWDPGLGRNLISALTECGLTGVEGVSYRRRAPGGPVWEAVRLGLIRLHDRIVENGASRESLNRLINVLNDPTYAITGAPTAISWGANSQ